MGVLVLGGSRGIGRAIAVGLTEPGSTILVNYLGPDEEAQETQRLVQEKGGRAVLLRGNIASPEGAAEIAKLVSAEVDKLDTVVHCAVKTVSGPLLDADPEAFRQAVDVNAMSFLYAVQAVRPLLGAGSSVVYLSSRGARIALKDYASVGAPKAMAEAFVRYLAVELAAIGARANVVSPTAQDTAAFRDIFPNDYEQRLAEAARRSPSGRAVGLDDIVEVVRFLASPGAAMLQGQTIVLDGASTLAG